MLAQYIATSVTHCMSQWPDMSPQQYGSAAHTAVTQGEQPVTYAVAEVATQGLPPQVPDEQVVVPLPPVPVLVEPDAPALPPVPLPPLPAVPVPP
jgi:hypothetical protein